jgi:hypothetical protein
MCAWPFWIAIKPTLNGFTGPDDNRLKSTIARLQRDLFHIFDALTRRLTQHLLHPQSMTVILSITGGGRRFRMKVPQSRGGPMVKDDPWPGLP